MTIQSEKKQPMLLLAPGACGWRAAVQTERGEWSVQEGASVAEALAAGTALATELRLVRENGDALAIHLALPARCGVFERLTLPSTEHDELDSMVRLQFEKNLPYPVEEAAFGYQILAQTPSQTTLLACALPHLAAASVCAPLLEAQPPARLSLWALHIAAQAPEDQIACGLWREEEKLLFGIFENRRLGFLENLSAEDDICIVLPRILMRAEMAGAPTAFTETLIDPALAGLKEPLKTLLDAPIRELHPAGAEPPQGEAPDFTPEPWRAQSARRKRTRQRRRQALIAVLAYATLLIAALLYLGIQNSRLQALRKQADALQPQLDAIIAQQTRWNTLAPAIDKKHYPVELLFQTWQSLPSPDTRITRFELAPSQLTLEGEAPNAQQAIAFLENLKKRPELTLYRFESGPPVLLPNEHAQYRIFGKQ